MIRVNRCHVAIGLALALSIAQPLFASTVLYRTDAQLIGLSERVVHARVVAQRMARGGPDGQTIYTVSTLDVLEDFTGQAGETLEVWELGGVIGNEVQYVGGGGDLPGRPRSAGVPRARTVRLSQHRHGPLQVRCVADELAVIARLTRNLRDTVLVGGRVPAPSGPSTSFARLAASRDRPAFDRRAAAPAAELQSADASVQVVPGRMALDPGRHPHARSLVQEHDCAAAGRAAMRSPRSRRRSPRGPLPRRPSSRCSTPGRRRRPSPRGRGRAFRTATASSRSRIRTTRFQLDGSRSAAARPTVGTWQRRHDRR